MMTIMIMIMIMIMYYNIIMTVSRGDDFGGPTRHRDDSNQYRGRRLLDRIAYHMQQVDVCGFDA